jgi:hypothetical protein
MFNPVWRQAATDAVKFWEPRRILYNLTLTIVVLACFWVEYPESKMVLRDGLLDLALIVFVLAVLANVAYCAAYFVDIFAQFTAYREAWQKYRWALFVLGTVFAGVIARFVAMGIFLPNR